PVPLARPPPSTPCPYTTLFRSLPIYIDLSQPTEGRAGNILKLFFVGYKVTAAVPVEPVLGGHPQVARTVLGHADDTALGQAVLHPQVLKGKALVVLSQSNVTKDPRSE